MVQGLGFLSKKSWHTKNLNNQEKVWIAEQQQEQERIRTTELAKQIQIEREQNEINEIAASATGGSKQKKVYDRGIDWMYTGPTKDSQTAKEDAQKVAEEYLLGKPIEFHSAAASESATADMEKDGRSIHRLIDAVVMSTDAATRPDAEERAGSVLSFQQKHKYEDPMYAVSLQTVRKERMIHRQHELYQKVGIATVDRDIGFRTDETGSRHSHKNCNGINKDDDDNDDDDDDDDGTDQNSGDEKYKSKTNKSKKKTKKSKNKHYQSNSDDDGDERRDRHRHRKRVTTSSTGTRKHDHHGSNERYIRHKRKRYDSDSKNDNDQSWSGHDSDRDTYKSKKYNDDDDDDNRRNKNQEHHRGSQKHHHTKHEEDYHNNSDSRPYQQQQKREEETKHLPGYGLVTSKYSLSIDHHSSRRSSQTDLGPDQEFVQRKGEEKINSHCRNHHPNRHNNNNYCHRNGRGRPPPNSEERAKALRVMEENAKSYDTIRQQQPTKTLNEHETTDGRTRAGATFIHEISQQVHGVYSGKK